MTVRDVAAPDAAPTAGAEIEAWMPHRAPMRLLDRLIRSSPEETCCAAEIRPGGPFVHQDQLPALVTLEHMAQAVAVHASKQSDAAARVGYLVGVRQLTLQMSQVPVGSCLEVRVVPVWGSANSGHFEGVVRADGREIARAKLSVFLPQTADSDV